MWTGIGVAARTQFHTLAATRGTRWMFYGTVVGIGMTLLGVLSGQVPPYTIIDLRQLALIPGVAITAVLMAEVPIRDGITRRTLLHLLAGPVHRVTLAVVRTLISVALTFVFLGAIQVTLAMASGVEIQVMTRELCAILLGSFAYVSVFSVIHLYTKHGLVAGLVVYLAADHFLGQVPFALRQIALSAHIANIAGHDHAISIGGLISVTPISVAGSVGLVAITGVVALVWTAQAFSKRDLAELC